MLCWRQALFRRAGWPWWCSCSPTAPVRSTVVPAPMSLRRSSGRPSRLLLLAGTSPLTPSRVLLRRHDLVCAAGRSGAPEPLVQLLEAMGAEDPLADAGRDFDVSSLQQHNDALREAFRPSLGTALPAALPAALPEALRPALPGGRLVVLWVVLLHGEHDQVALGHLLQPPRGLGGQDV